MNRLPRGERAKVLHLLCEGQSIRAVAHLTGCSKNTVTKLLVDAGAACAAYQDRVLRHLSCKRVQVDETWSFVRVKAANLPKAKVTARDASDVWTWVALDTDTKLICSFYVGDRGLASAREFINDLAERFANRVQLTCDGRRAHLKAVSDTFGGGIDYAQLVKIYGADNSRSPERRCSPPECIGVEKKAPIDDPDPAHISTSFVERQNLTMRTSMRRFTRLTNGLSKIESHACAVALHAMFYNFVRIHQTLKTTPTMAAGITDRLWEMTDVVEIIEAHQQRQITQVV